MARRYRPAQIERNGAYPRRLFLRALLKGDSEALSAELRAGAHPDAGLGRHHQRPLQIASCRGHGDAAAVLLEKGAKVNGRDGRGRTALMDAAARGHTALVRALLRAGALPDLEDLDGRTALHDAAEGGHAACIEALAEHGTDLGASVAAGETPLMAAARIGSISCVRLLLRLWAVADRTNDAGETALMKAAQGGHIDTALALLDAGADAGRRNAAGQSAMDLVPEAHRAAFGEALRACADTPEDTRSMCRPPSIVRQDRPHLKMAVLAAAAALLMALTLFNVMRNRSPAAFPGEGTALNLKEALLFAVEVVEASRGEDGALPRELPPVYWDGVSIAYEQDLDGSYCLAARSDLGTMEYRSEQDPNAFFGVDHLQIGGKS